ncbi:MAG: phosphate acyltransferase PlsX [Oscillospiraceae bacterium]|nr:phosphate acyltransferase PlsX [Oscillospiraceae bacterium]
MKIIIDAMGGDHAPLEIVKGALSGQQRLGVELVLTGHESAIMDAVRACGMDALPAGVTIRHTAEEVSMHDDPATVFRKKKDTSMGVGLTMLKNGEGDAFISAGSTGALLTGATLITKRVRGIRRAAMAPLIPTTTGKAVLIDCGANAECTAEYLVQFAHLGSFYAKSMLGLENPRVGLLNIGTEPEKGTDLQRAAYGLLQQEQDINFIGNIEAKEAVKGGCDVIVCDGFSGNVFLKTMEGVGSFAGSALKGIFKKNLLTKLAALAVMPGLNAFRAMLDPNKVGGTAFIGVAKPVIKAHGSSNAEAIENAMVQAGSFAESGFIQQMEQYAATLNGRE